MTKLQNYIVKDAAKREEEERLQRKQKEKEERLKKENEEFLDDLIKQADENNVITLALYDNESGNALKQIAMNYLLFERDFVCVQNDVSSEERTTVFTLTFVKRGNLSRFSIGNI